MRISMLELVKGLSGFAPGQLVVHGFADVCVLGSGKQFRFEG
jgi:hypothetical protein